MEVLEGGQLARHQEDHTTAHLDGVIGEALVEASQQGDVDGRRHTVLPFAVHEHREQVAVEIIHRFVLLVEACRALGVSGFEDLAGCGAERHGDPAHLGEVSADLIGKHVIGVTSTRGLRDVQGKRTHPIDIGDDLDSAHHCAQVAGDRTLQREKCECLLFTHSTEFGDLVVLFDHHLREREVGLEQGLGGPFHRRSGEPGHFAE